MASEFDIRELLTIARRRLRRQAFRRQFVRLLTWSVGLVGGAAVLDHLYRFPDWQRWVVGLGIVAALAAVYWYGRDRRSHGRRFSDLFVARELEKANPALHNALVTALQTNRTLTFSTDVHKEIDTALANLTQRPAPSPRRWLLPAELVLLTVYALTAPQSLWQSTSRVLMPWRAISPPTYTVIVGAEPTDDDYLITENPWRITLTAAGYVPESGDVHARRDAGPWQRIPLTKQPETRQYVATLPPVSGQWTFRGRLGDAYLPQRTVTVLQRPVSLGVRQTLDYPDYLSQDTVELQQRPVQAVVGTRIDLEVQLDRNVEAAKIDWCGTSIALRPVGRLLRTNAPISVEHSGSWRVYYQLPEADEWIRGDGAQVTAVPDLLPQAKLLAPTHDVEVSADSLVEFQFEATDDFIVSSPEVVIRRFGSDESRVIPLPEPVLPDRLAGTWTFLPQEFDAEPGDRFTVAIRVRDGHPAHLPGWSEAIAVTVTAPLAPIVADNSLELENAANNTSTPPTLDRPPPKATNEPANDGDNLAETKKPDEPLTQEQLDNAKLTDQPADPDAQPDAIVEADNTATDPNSKPQPLTSDATSKDPPPATANNDEQSVADQDPQSQPTPSDQAPADTDANQQPPADQQAANDQESNPGEQPGDQSQQSATDPATNDAQPTESDNPDAQQPGEQQTASDDTASDKPPADQPNKQPSEQPGEQQTAQKPPEQKPGDSKPGDCNGSCDKGCDKPGCSKGESQNAANKDGKPGSQPGSKPGADGNPGQPSEDGQKTADQQAEKPADQQTADNNRGKPGQQPGQESGDSDQQQTASNQQDNNDPSAKPGETNQPSDNSSGKGAEFAGDQTGGNPDPGDADATAVVNDNTELPDFLDPDAPTAANSATPFDGGNQTTADQPDLATNQAPSQPDVAAKPNAPEETADNDPQTTELETFERMTIDASQPSTEVARQSGDAAPSPGFAAPQYSADDVDLIQSFREAANRLLQRDKKQ